MPPANRKSQGVLSQASIDTLLHLSRDLRKQGCYLQAAKCLEAAYSSNTQALPATKAIACLDYAELLLDHFDNLDLAKSILFKAERELRSTKTHHTLKCEVYHHLIRCHRASNDVSQAIEAAKLGLAVCTSQQGSKQKQLIPWRTYFTFRLAEFTLETSTPAATLLTLDTIDTNTITPAEQALLALSRAVAHLHAAEFDAADQQLTTCASAIESALAEDGRQQEGGSSGGGTSKESEMIQHMRAQYFLLYAIVAQAVGRAGQLQQEKDYPIFSHLQEAITTTSPQQSPPSHHNNTWLPPPATAALGHMLHAAVLRAAGRGSAAAMQLGQAEEVLENVLSAARVNWSSKESELPPTIKSSMHVYIHLRAIAGEHRALASLLSTDFVSAAQHIVQLIGAVQRYPSILSSRIPSIAMLVGHYAHSTKEYEMAVKLFTSVMSSSSKSIITSGGGGGGGGGNNGIVVVNNTTPASGGNSSGNKNDSNNDATTTTTNDTTTIMNTMTPRGMHAVAAICCALSRLHQGQEPDILDSARRILESNYMDSTSLSNIEDMPTHEKASAQLVNGLLLYMQKDIPGARLLLTKALKQAHGLIGSTQLVGQVLNVLAPVQQDRQDYAGAAQMYESSMTLLKSVGDLPSLVTTLHGLHDLHKKQGKEDLAVKSEQYLERKAADLVSRLDQLAKSREHAQVLQLAEWLIANM